MATTSLFLLGNLHCPSCVSNIEKALSALSPAPLSISSSILTSWVTIRHEPSLMFGVIQSTLEEAGFEVYTVIQDGVARDVPTVQPPRPTYNPLDSYLHRTRLPGAAGQANIDTRQRHLQDCEQCKAELEEEGYNHQDIPLRNISKFQTWLKTSNISREDITRNPASSTSSLTGTTIDGFNERDTWRASLAIGGMTCASCANAITEEVQKIHWVEKVTVNLITNSAVIDFIDKDNGDKLVEAIEDIGFEAVLDSVVELKEQKATLERTIALKIDGMFCSHCPNRLQSSLDTFRNRICIEKLPSTQDSIMRLTYLPHTPDLTVRSILARLNGVDERFTVSVHHPPTLEERSEKMHALERRRILARVVLSITAAIPTFVIGVVFMSLVSEQNSARHYLMQPLDLGISRAQWSLFIMATPVYFFAADAFHRRAVLEVYNLWKPGSKTPFLQRFYRFGSMNMLMSLGTSVAYISSVAQLIVAAVNRARTPRDDSFYFDSVVFLTMFLLIGRLIEAYSKSKTGDAVKLLGKLRPTEATLIEKTADSITRLSNVQVDELEIDDTIKVVHGASPPCDGVVVEGETIFDESSLTGESRLVKKKIGDEVFAGTLNNGSPITMRITGLVGSSMLDHIVMAVREGQTRRAPIEKIADSLTAYFVPFITLIAVSTWIIWLSIGYSGSLPDDYKADNIDWAEWSLQFAIAALVVACPCGLALAAPTAIFVGGGLAAKHGILVKGGGEAFEKASQLDCVVFDKTGTLTVGGEPSVTDYQFTCLKDDLTKDTILNLVKKIEQNSSHPIAKAIISFCSEQSTSRLNVYDIEEIPGKGLKGVYSPNTKSAPEFFILIGNELLMSEFGVHISDINRRILESWKSQGKSVALVAIRSSIASSYSINLLLSISDEIRPEAVEVIRTLCSRGVDVWMLSGDNPLTAAAVGAQVGIVADNIISGVLPSQKAEKIRHLQQSLKARDSSGKERSNKRALVAMVGDGINDSPALTAADVGIAIGSGSDIAISSAEFVLISHSLRSLVTLLDLSKTVFRRVKFNFAWALVYNMVAVPVAAGAFYAIRTGVDGSGHVKLDPVWASLAMACSSISVVLSSLSLRSRLPGVGFRVRKDIPEKV